MSIRSCLVVAVVFAGAFGPVQGCRAADSGAGEPQVGTAPEPQWRSLGGDFRRTGLSVAQGPIPVEVAWRFETAGAVIGSVTVGADGRVHIACEDGVLYTLDSGGNALWTTDVNSPLLSAPSIGPDGGLYIGSADGRLYAVEPHGSLRWSHETGDAIYSSPAVDADGTVYFGSTDGSVYAVGSDGAERWRFKTEGPGVLPDGAVFASPALGSDGTVYVGGLYDPNLYALDPFDGSVRWACRFPDMNADGPGGRPFASPVVGDDGTIYQTLLYDSHLYAIKPAGGTIAWSVDLCDPNLFAGDPNAPTDSEGWSEPVLGPDGTIYVSLDDPYLRAVDPNGMVRWVTKLGDLGGFTMAVDSAHVIYAAGDDGRLYAVAPDGQELARLETGGWPVFPALAGPDLLILADSKDYSAFEAEQTNTVWAITSPILIDTASQNQ